MVKFTIQIFCSLVIFSSYVLGFQSICKKLQVSTDIQLIKDDVVKNGAPVDKWNQNTQYPQLISSSILLDYLYVTIEGSHKTLNQNAFKLIYDDHFFANSSLSVSNQKVSKSGGLYTLEIKYKCKEYGGALVNYQIEISVPECGLTTIFWKKVCGNPLIPREGLFMDVEYKKYNQTIVKNGQLVDASYFDEDLDQFVFSVPSNAAQTKFYLYMNLPNKTKEETKTEFFKAIVEQPDDKEEEADEPEFQVLEAILKMIPEVIISAPIVDADTSVMNPKIGGQLATGGIITNQPSSLTLTYNCHEQADSTIELNIPIEYFRDLNLIFVKKCMTSKGIFSRTESQTSWFTWFFIGFLLFEVIGTFYNVLAHKMSGFEAVPFMSKIIQQLLKFELVQKFSMRLGRNSSKPNNFPYKSANETNEPEEFEQEFKLENKNDISNKYGSV